MLKMKCSKYPKEKCKDYEDRTFKDCKLCIYNMYHSLESLNNSKDCFKKFNQTKTEGGEKMKVLKTKLSIEVDGVYIEYGQIPSGLIEGWKGIIFYFKTNSAYDTKLHEKVISKVIEQLEYQSFNHWQEWRQTKIEAITWSEHCQITLASFRVKDSY